jgi:hypothetical protein
VTNEELEEERVVFTLELDTASELLTLDAINVEPA